MKGRFSLGQLVPIGALVGFAGLFVWTCAATSDVTDVAEEYVEHLRAGRTDEAYAMLVERRREELTASAYLEAMSTPILRDARGFAWRKTEGPSDGRACVVGHVETSAGTRGVRIYLVEEDGELRVHTVLVYDGVVPAGPWICDGV